VMATKLKQYLVIAVGSGDQPFEIVSVEEA
jgi:hypothetical protein